MHECKLVFCKAQREEVEEGSCPSYVLASVSTIMSCLYESQGKGNCIIEVNKN